MIGYVESNFVLEIALGQEGAAPARRLLEGAREGALVLVIPSFCLFEPYSKVTNNAHGRRRLSEELEGQLRQIMRNPENREQAAAARAAWGETAVTLDMQEMDGLEATVGDLLGVARVLPLTAQVYEASRIQQTELGLSPQDAIVYSSVIGDLASLDAQEEKFFVSRDAKAFGSPEIRDQLGGHGCRFFPTFEAACGYLRLDA